MDYDGFISYVRQRSRTEVLSLKNSLKEQGIHLFLDEEGIEAGDAFPDRLADALINSRLVLVFLDDKYFDRPWCVYEFQVALAPYRKALMRGESPAGLLDNIMVILDPKAEEIILSHLPPPLAKQNWPSVTDTERITELVKEKLQKVTKPLSVLIDDLKLDFAIQALRKGADAPPAGDLSGRPLVHGRLPRSLSTEFVGRTESLWNTFHYLETCRVAGHPSSCGIVGTAGVGKTQLAAEYVWRYAPQQYLGGVVWITAEEADRALEDQFKEVLRVFAFDESVSETTDTTELRAALRKHVTEAAKKGRVLWVVDNLPPPAAGKKPAPLEHWCPPRNVVDLLCTSRRAMIREVDAQLTLRELSLVAATDWLTRPPVLRQRLTEEEWYEVVRWVGCLPLALRILHTSLAEFVDPKDFLARSRGKEPAAALDDEVDSLSEEFPAEYLRGIAESLHDAYRNLELQPELQRSVHLLSWLAPIPTPSKVTLNIVSQRHVAQLANRGWIETTFSSSNANIDWRMHRVVASYLVTRSLSGIDELSSLANWLITAFDQDSDWESLNRIVPHAFYILWGINRQRLQYKSSPVQNHIAAALHIATFRFSERGADALRYESARLVSEWGYSQKVLDQIDDRVALYEASMLTGVARILPAINTAAAAEVCAKLISDKRTEVREAGLSIADSLIRHPGLAKPLLDSILVSTDRASMFTELHDKPTRYHYFTGNYTGATYRVQSTSPDGQPQKVVWDPSFWKTVQNKTARESLIRLAKSKDTDMVAKQLALALCTSQSLEEGLQAIDRLGLLLRAIHTPEPFKFEEIIRIDQATNEVLGESYHLREPVIGEQHPGKYAPLIELAFQTNDNRLSRRAIQACLWTEAGSTALSNQAHKLLDEGESQLVYRLSEMVISADDNYTNGYWWRALALADMVKAEADIGKTEAAIADFGLVIDRIPNFYIARIKRAEMFIELNDKMAALRELNLAGQKTAGDLESSLDIALGRSEQYLRLEDFEQAEWSSREAIYILDKKRRDLEHAQQADVDYFNQAYADCYWLHGLALAGLGDSKLALEDLDEVLKISPDFTYARIECVRLLTRLGDRKRALKELERVRESTHNNVEIALACAHQFLSLEAFDEAEDAATLSIELENKCAKAWLIRAVARRHQDKVDDAYQDARKAEEIDPNDQDIKDFLNSFDETL